LETSPNWRPIVGSAVATMVWSRGGQKHRQHQADQDGADLILGQRRRRRDRRRVADIHDLGRDVREFAGNFVGQCIVVGRLTALPFELGHLRRNIFYVFSWRPKAAELESLLQSHSRAQITLRQAVARMGASRAGAFAIA